MAKPTSIPLPTAPIIDPRTGAMSRAWYLFFINLFNLTGAGGNTITLDELQIGPPPSGTSFEALAYLQAYAETLPVVPQAMPPQDVQPPFVCVSPQDDLAPIPQPPSGASGTFTTVDLKTVTVSNGIIVSIV